VGQPYVGEIRIFAGNFAPAGWALCQGQLLAISENDTLYNLIGTTYGGDGQSTFALPNLQSRIPIHQGSNGFGTYTIGQNGGEEQVTLTTNQLPSHTHSLATATAAQGGGTRFPGISNVLADQTLGSPPFVYAAYNNNANQRALNSAAVTTAGGSQPHDNMVPFLCVNFIISLFGIYPST
jgi:microcystin-dependent protein